MVQVIFQETLIIVISLVPSLVIRVKFRGMTHSKSKTYSLINFPYSRCSCGQSLKFLYKFFSHESLLLFLPATIVPNNGPSTNTGSTDSYREKRLEETKRDNEIESWGCINCIWRLECFQRTFYFAKSANLSYSKSMKSYVKM